MLVDRVVLGHMIDNKRGVIIHIGSVDGETGGGVDYAAEKSGLTYGLTKAIARVGAPYGVRCCGVTPGPVLTRASKMCIRDRVYGAAYLFLFVEGRLQAGDTVLVQAGASGLASVAIPMAKAFGARVITTVLTLSLIHI